MATRTATRDGVIHAPRSGRLAPVRHGTGGFGVLAAILTLALAVVVGVDGSPGWRAIRVLVVVAIGGLATVGGRRARAPGRAAMGFGLGLAGVVAGGGVASAHLAKAGLTVTSIAAAVALLAGLVLLARGTGALVRALRGWWRLLAIPAGLAVLVFLLYPLVVAVNATNRPPGRLGARGPADVGLVARDVSFATTDGARLSAWYAPGSNGAAVVLLHGAGSTRTAVLDHAAVLASHGYGVLLVDGRGHGRSEGHAMDLGWYGPPDVTGAISFLQGEGVGRVAVVGLSMGGEGAVAAAGTDPRIAAVVAEGVTGMQEVDHGWLPGGVNGAAERILERVQYAAADLLSGASRPMPMRDAIAAAAPRPFLLVAAGSDPDEVDAARWFRAASQGSVRLWVVPGAGHTGGLATDPEGWESRVVGFLDATLLER
jgi:uncharacterized protein